MKSFKIISLFVILGLFVTACATPTPETIIETVVVEKEGETIIETVEVVVVETVEVETVVTQEVEVIVDPTACNVEPPAEATTINFFGWTYPIADAYADEFANCGDVENIDVNVQLLGNQEVRDAVNLALAGGAESPYDILHMANSVMPEYVDGGYLLPLNDLVDKYRDEYDLDDISQTAWNGATFDGNIYGVPSAGNTKHLAYRTDLFEQYGLDVPTTFDEVIAACAVLADEPSIDIPFTMNLHAGWAWEFQFRNVARAYGMASLVDEDSMPLFNGPEGVAAGEKIKEVVDACMGDEGLTYSIDDSEVGMENGALAFVYIWASRGAPMHDPEKSAFVDQIAFAPAPVTEIGGLMAGGSWNDFYGIPATSTVDPDLAFRLIMESLDLRSQTEAAALGIVTRASVAEGVPNLEAAGITMANGVGAYGKNPATPLAETVLGNWLPFIGTGEMTAQEALDAAAEEYIEEATAQGFLD